MKKIIIILVFIIFLYWVIKPLFHSGFFPMHDDQQIARLYEMDKSIVSGQIPPRWVSNLGFGYGYPLYNFYPPLVYYIGETFHLVGFNLITSTKIVMALGFILAAISMYFFAKELLDKKSAILAALLYTYAPYHAVDLYVRGALAEFFSFIFFPLGLLGIRKLILAPSINSILFFTFSLSGLILTHNLMVFPFGIFLTIYTIYLFIKTKNKKPILSVIYSLLLSFGLTAFFTLPALIEKKFTLVDTILIRELANYKLHFVYLRQFWNSAWGYGGSLYGLEDGMSFQVGKLQIILFLLGLISLIFVLIKKKKFNSEIFLFSLLTIFSIFLASFHSEKLWSVLTPLWYIQFPWRFLSITAIFISIVGAFGALSVISLLKSQKIQIILWFLFFSSVIFLNQGYFTPAKYLEVTDKDYTTKEDVSWRISKTSFEFVPKGVATVLSDIKTTQLDIKKDEVAKNLYEVMAGNILVKTKSDLPHKKTFEIESINGGTLRINTFNFPGWEVKIDGVSALINDKNKLKLVTVNVPKGKHVIIVEFKNTPIRLIGNIISIFTFLLIILIAINKKCPNRSKKNK